MPAVDLRDGRVGAYLRSEFLRGGGHGLGNRPHAADHVPVKTLNFFRPPAQQME